MAEPKDVLQGVLVKALNLTEAEVSSLYTEDGGIKDDAQDTILARHAEAVKKQREAAKAEREAQFARGAREKGEEWEKTLKAVGVDLGDAKGEEAVQKLKDHIAAQVKPSDLDDDKVKASALFRKREKELLDQVALKEKEHNEYITKRDAEEQRKSTLNTAKQKARTVLDGMRPNLSENPEKAARQLRLLEMEVEAMHYDIEGDDIFVKDAEGKRVETAAGHPMKFDDFVKSKAELYYDFAVSEPKGSMGDPTRGTVTKSAVKLQKPASRKAYADKLNEISNDPSLKPEEKAALATELKELASDLA